MDLTRRRALLAGLSVAGTALAGCLSGGSPAPGTDGTNETTDDGRGEFDGDDEGDDSDGDDDAAGDGELPDGVDRVDEPPYEITEPECDPPEDGRDPLWLCENMPGEPSLSFAQAATRGTFLADEGLQLDESEGRSQYYATLLTEPSDRDRLRDDDSDAAALVEEADFGSEAVLVVQTGWGSGSVTPHVKRVEETDEGIRAFGCERQPCVYTSDLTSRTAAVRFERPETLESTTVSLTVGAEKRVNVAAGEGVVSLGDRSD